jgi:uncharacterized membrane protein
MAETMARRSARPIAIARHPINSILLPVPVVCFLGALLTDLAYKCSGGNLQWVNFSTWLIAGGLAVGAIAAIFLLIDAARGAATWLAFGLFVAAWVVELINSLVHARDGWTAVVPLGLTLSVIAAILILVSGWLWREVAP